MSHHHSHQKPQSIPSKHLFVTMALNFAITLAEAVGGYFSGSLSLLSDAMHNFSDGIAIIIAYAAIRVSRAPRSFKYTFGLKRAELLAAVINASTLIIISFFLIKEAIDRFSHPSPIAGGLMLGVATLGLTANAVGTWLLKSGAKDNINIRAAYVHLLSDSISSVAVILGALGIIVYRVYWIDPVLTILISLYILHETYEIIRESVDVIMMSSPSGIDLQEVKEIVEALPRVKNIHHVHVWKLNDNDIHFEAHVEVENISVVETSPIQREIEQRLHHQYGITHTTLQFECDNCESKAIV
jgi:cobalt-zinc-cadmium efflux system protein